MPISDVSDGVAQNLELNTTRPKKKELEKRRKKKKKANKKKEGERKKKEEMNGEGIHGTKPFLGRKGNPSSCGSSCTRRAPKLCQRTSILPMRFTMSTWR